MYGANVTGPSGTKPTRSGNDSGGSDTGMGYLEVARSARGGGPSLRAGASRNKRRRAMPTPGYRAEVPSGSSSKGRRFESQPRSQMTLQPARVHRYRRSPSVRATDGGGNPPVGRRLRRGRLATRAGLAGQGRPQRHSVSNAALPGSEAIPLPALGRLRNPRRGGANNDRHQ